MIEKLHGNSTECPHHQQGKYTLIGFDGQPYKSKVPGTLGGHRLLKLYGRLDCPSALRFIARGQYVKHRVFFANEEDAIGAGYRPCAKCLPEKYKEWKDGDRVLHHLTNRANSATLIIEGKQ